MMRKKVLFIPLLLAAGVLTLGHISAITPYQRLGADPEPESSESSDPESSSEPEPAVTEANHYMPFNNTNFTETGDHGYARLGHIRTQNETTWSGRFNALDSFFTGEGSGVNENESGYFDSVSWYQKKANPYVYFTLAGNSRNYIEVLRKSNNTVLGSINNDQFNGNPMVMNYIEIDTSTLSEDEEVFLRIHDDSYQDDQGGYRFVTFGYCHVNATDKDVSDAIWTHINSLTIAYDAGNVEANYRIRETMNFYLNGKASTDGILLLSDDKNISANENFDNNATFLNNWYRDTTYDFVTWDDNGYHESANINDRYDKGWGSIISNGAQHRHERMPFNKTGSGFFKGYREAPEGTDDVTGFMDTDRSKYRFVSKPFVLSGTGFVSIKMSGHPASLHVLRGNTDLAFIDVKTNSRKGVNTNITTGYNCLTMVRHVINLSAFKGQVIQLAIADVNCNTDYGAANFDELITKYDSNPTFQVDKVVQYDSINNYYLDYYVPKTNSNNGVGVDYTDDVNYNFVSDDSPVNEAYNFLKGYYEKLRSPSSHFDYEYAGENNRDLVAGSYLMMSNSAKVLAGAAEDVRYNFEFSNEWYSHPVDDSNSIYSALSSLIEDYAAVVTINANNGKDDSIVKGAKPAYVLPACPFDAPEGKKFAGWKINNAGELLQPGAPVSVNEDENFELDAIWVDTAQTKMQALTTRATLAYDYVKNGENDYEFSNVKIRYGGLISKALWDELDEESGHTILGYGVMISTESLGETKLNDSNKQYDMFVDASTKAHPSLANASQKEGLIDAANDYYVWSLRLDIAPGYYTTTITAVAYVKTSEGYVYLNQTAFSAKDLANDYIENRGFNVDFEEGAMNHLAHLA